MRTNAREKHKVKEKLSRAQIQKRNELWKISRDEGRISIPIKPYQDGFLLSYKVRDDYSRSRFGDNLRKALDLVNISQVSQTKDWYGVERQLRQKKGFKPTIKRLQTRILNENKLYELPQEIRKFFIRVKSVTIPFIGGGTKEINYYTLDHRYLELVAKPRIITHRQELDGNAESKYQRHENHVKTHNIEAEYNHYYDGYYGCRCEYCMGLIKQRKLKNLTKKELMEHLNGSWESQEGD